MKKLFNWKMLNSPSLLSGGGNKNCFIHEAVKNHQKLMAFNYSQKLQSCHFLAGCFDLTS
jgi:hypothetical protein